MNSYILVLIIVFILLFIIGGTVAALIGTGVIPTSLTTVDCDVGPWTSYSSCTGGTQSRTRNITVQPKGKGKVCPSLTETITCTNTLSPIDCQVTWGPCISGQQTGTVTRFPSNSGAPCPTLTRECNANCTYQWSPCVNGTETVINYSPPTGTGTCDVTLNDTRSCIIDCAFSDWVATGTCQVVNGTGAQLYTRTMTQMNYNTGCSGLTSEYRFCNLGFQGPFYLEFKSYTGIYVYVPPNNNLFDFKPNPMIKNNNTKFYLDPNNYLMIYENNNYFYLSKQANTSLFSKTTVFDPNTCIQLKSSLINSNDRYLGVGNICYKQDLTTALSFTVTTTFTECALLVITNDIHYPQVSKIKISANCNTDANILKTGIYLSLNQNKLLGTNIIDSSSLFYYFNKYILVLPPNEKELYYIDVTPNQNSELVPSFTTQVGTNTLFLTNNSLYIKNTDNIADKSIQIFTETFNNTAPIRTGSFTLLTNTDCNIISSFNASLDLSNPVTTPYKFTGSNGILLNVGLTINGGPYLYGATTSSNLQDGLSNNLNSTYFLVDQAGFLRYKFNNQWMYIDLINNKWILPKDFNVPNNLNADVSAIRVFYLDCKCYMRTNIKAGFSATCCLGTNQTNPFGYKFSTNNSTLSLTTLTITTSTDNSNSFSTFTLSLAS